MHSKLIVLPDAVDRVVSEIEVAGSNETGGILLGWQRPDLGLWVVAHVTGPGTRARATPTSLRLDTLALQRDVDQWFESTQGEISYLGDWHLHHEADPVPSPADRRSAREVAQRPEIGLRKPLTVIVGESDGNLQWRAWVGRRLTPAAIEFVEKSGSRETGDPSR